MYMFRAISYLPSGGQIVLIQHLISSLSVSDRPVHRLRKNAVLSQLVHRTVCLVCRAFHPAYQTVIHKEWQVPSFLYIQLFLLMMGAQSPETSREKK